MVITDKQYDNLPPLAQSIVDQDRALAEIMAPEVIPIGMAKKIKELGDRKRELTAHAGKTWGSSKKDGPGAHA